jgi:diguanylate cyclase (GGDEF)-like protein
MNNSAWDQFALQQLVRYEALFELLDDIQKTEDIASICDCIARQWKYFANVANWRLVVTKTEGFKVIDGFRGQALIEDTEYLDSWDFYFWERQLPQLVPVDTTNEDYLPPKHMNGTSFVEIQVLPFFRSDSCIGLLSAAARHEPFSDLDKRFIRLFGSFFTDRIYSILLRQRAEEVLIHKATYDPLTKIWNRGAIIEHLNSHLALSERTKQPLSLIICDIDFFKAINDKYGHLAGDAILVEVAKRLEEQTREGERLGRYGGEEFLAVLYPCNQVQAEHVAERMRKIIQSIPFKIGDPIEEKAIDVTISLGVFCQDGNSVSIVRDLLKLADAALYQSKSAGRNRISVASQGM